MALNVDYCFWGVRPSKEKLQKACDEGHVWPSWNECVKYADTNGGIIYADSPEHFGVHIPGKTNEKSLVFIQLPKH